MSKDLYIIGAGPAGYTAAIYAARANLKPIMMTGIQDGGQLTITTDVDNYPGFADTIQGPELMIAMRGQAERMGVKIIGEMITDVDFTNDIKILKGDSGTDYKAGAVIISTGASARWLGLPSEQKYMNQGVSACATCDGFFYRNQTVAVIGGGNTAVEEALYLSNIAKKVYLVHRRDELRAERILSDRLLATDNITPLWHRVVDEILGDEKTQSVKGLRLNSTMGEEPMTIDLDGVFIAIGHDPATKPFIGKLDMDEEGYIITKPDSTKTSVEGVFAAGDVKDKIYRQAVTAAGMGCMAALEADKYLSNLS